MPKTNKKHKVFELLKKLEGPSVLNYYRIMKIAGLSNQQILDAIYIFKETSPTI